MNKLRRILNILICWVIALAPPKGSADPIHDDLKALTEAYKKVHGQYPDSVNISSQQINGVTVYHASISRCNSNNTCTEVFNKTYRESTGFKEVDGKFYQVRTIDGFSDDRILASNPTRMQQAPKPQEIKRIDYVAGYSTSASSGGFNGSLQMRISPAPDLKKELQQILPSVVDAVTNSAKDLDRAVKTSQVLHEAYQNNLKALEKFTALLENRREIIAKNGNVNESVSSTALSMMSAQINTSSVSTEMMEELRRFESVKQDPFAFRQYEFTDLAERDLVKATDHAIKEKNIRELAKNAEAGNAQIDIDKRKAFADRYKNFVDDGIVQVGAMNPRLGAAPLDGRRFEVPENTPAGQALRRTGNLAQVLWSEQGAFEYATDQSKAAYVAGLVSLSSAESSFVNGDYTEGFERLVASSKFLQASVGFTKGLYGAGKDAVMAYPLMVQAVAALSHAIIEDPSAVMDKAAGLILTTPEIGAAIVSSIKEYRQKFIDGDAETRGEILGRISGEVILNFYSGGAVRAVRGIGVVAKIEGKVAKAAQLIKPSAALGEAIAREAVKLEPILSEAYSLIHKNTLPGINATAKFDKILSAYAKVKLFPTSILPEVLQQRRLLVEIRNGYNLEVKKMGEYIASATAKGESLENIARNCNNMRRSAGEFYKNLTPENIRKEIYRRNLVEYENALGPTFDEMVSKLVSEGKDLPEAYRIIIGKSQATNVNLNEFLTILQKELP